MTKPRFSRRLVLGAGLTGGAMAAAQLRVTPPHTEGPFYPTEEQADKDADLTRIGDSDTRARGEIITVEGRVLSESGEAIGGAVVDVWQANAAGRYAHERDPNPAPLDPHFQGWAIMTTAPDGRYRFRSVRPGAYPIRADWTRPPHIHFKVARRGYREITTQMYFDGEPLNDADLLLNELKPAERPSLIARRESAEAPYRFDVVLAAV